MERAKRKLYTCLMVVVFAAVLIGLIYYWSEVNRTEIENRGTLVLAGREML